MSGVTYSSQLNSRHRKYPVKIEKPESSMAFDFAVVTWCCRKTDVWPGFYILGHIVTRGHQGGFIFCSLALKEPTSLSIVNVCLFVCEHN